MPLRFPLQFQFRPHFMSKELRGFYAHIFALRTADALLVIATPVALYQFGQNIPFITSIFPGKMEAGLGAVLLFYILERSTAIILAKPLSSLFRHLGMSHAMMVGQFFRIAFLCLFPFIRNFPWLFPVAAILQGAGVFLYWSGHFAYFSSVAKPRHAGEEVSVLEFMSRLAMVVAPLVAAFLAVRFGYISVFLTGAALAAASASLLLFIPNFRTKLEWRWHDLADSLRDHEYRPLALGVAGFAWEEIGLNIMWPVFLFVTFERITTVSYILSGASLASLLLVYLSGLAFDGRRGNRLQAAAGACWGLLWVPRALFAQFPLALVVTEAIDRLLSSVYGTLFSATLLIRSKQKNILAFYINREIILSLTLVVGFSLGIVLLWVGWNWSLVFLSFLVGALASLNLHRQGKIPTGAKL